MLVIDDSAMLLRFVANVLGARTPSLEVLTARRGNEGFYQADRLRPDLILLDHALPDLPGEALCRRLENNQATATLPVIVLCGRSADPQTIRAGHANVIGTLSKPFTPDELAGAVRAAFAAEPREIATSAAVESPSGRNAARGKTTVVIVPGERRRQTPSTATKRLRARLPLPVPLVSASNVVATADRRGEGGDDKQILFRGTTANFSLRTALRAAAETRLSGVLRLTPLAENDGGTRVPVSPTEVYLRAGTIVLVTTRDPDLYGAAPPVGGAIEALRREQHTTGCPPFLALVADGQEPTAEALVEAGDYGQRLFARLWAHSQLGFEFERLTETPGFVRRLPEASPVTPSPSPSPDLGDLDEAGRAAVQLDDWLLRTLRRLRPEDLPGRAGESWLSGVPAYTREGYTTVRRLRLTDLEAAFVRQINGRTDLRTLARQLGLGGPAALLLMFRFHSVGLMDLWPANALARQGGKEAATGG